MQLLAEAGCSLDVYKNQTTDYVMQDLKLYVNENKGVVFPYTIADIAEELIAVGNEQLAYPTNGENSEDISQNGDICHLGFSELYEDAEVALRELISNKTPFDTGWLGCKKEIESCRIQSNGQSLLISVHAEMDDYPEILGDYEGIDFTEKTEKEYEDEWAMGDWVSEFDCREEIPATTYEEMIITLVKLENQARTRLHEWYVEFGIAIGAKNVS